MPDRIGALRERLTLQTRTPPVLTVVSITRAGTVATVVTAAAHTFLQGDFVTVGGALPAAYSGRVAVASVVNGTTFTYAISGSPATPATGVITVVYVSDAQGGRRPFWQTVATVPAEEIPLRTYERLQLAAVQAGTFYQFAVRSRPDLDPTMRALWTPSWPPGALMRTLTILGVRPDADNYDPSVQLRFMILDCVDAPVLAAA